MSRTKFRRCCQGAVSVGYLGRRASQENDNLHALMVFGDLLPSLPIHVAVGDGLGDRESPQLLRELRLGPDYLCFNQGRRTSSGCGVILAA
jgi:hypothetical protein